MKYLKLSAFVLLTFLAFTETRSDAEVLMSARDNCLRVEIDGQLFTEWRHRDWVAPFLYPVLGPNGENITRHFPMKSGVAGEEQDHPWHRSIRFSHSDVNGFNFWWAPGKARAGHTAEIQFEKIDDIKSGPVGEVVFWNRWLGDGNLVLRERVRLAFTPLKNREVLMDYDTELHAAEKPVTFGDKRDGGLLVRVAGSMKVEDEKGNKFAGTIVNSRGDRNRDAWGKKAEWTDYSGPEASGKVVGIAMFDHPLNLRFPTPWHVRTYGLMTANRFGTDHFKANYDDHKTVVCHPAGNTCPACLSHSGDHTIAAGDKLLLRHRFFFHHGDADAAQVAKQYHAYASSRSSILARMRELQRERRWRDMLNQFEGEDFAVWSSEFPKEAAEVFHLRGQAYAALKNAAKAEADFNAAIRVQPHSEVYLLSLADHYAYTLNDSARALALYRQVSERAGRTHGWISLTATLSSARVLIDQVKPQEALDLLQAHGDLEKMPKIWRIKFLRTYGHAYAGLGNEAESLAKFREALTVEATP